MKATKILALGAVAIGMSAIALAQFDGPTPLAWRWSPPSVEYSPDGAPTVVNGTVYVAAKGRIFALDASTGNEKWKFPLEPANGTFRVQPTLAAGTIVDVTDGGKFYAANSANGSPKWTYQVKPDVPVGQPVAVGNLILFKQSNNVLNALSVDTGQPAWPKPLAIDGGINGPLLVHDNDVIFADNNNQMYSVSAVTQKVNWKRQFGYLPPGLVPTMYGDNVYLYSGQYLVCLNAIRGAAKWQVNLGQNMEFGPAVGADGMMCVTEDGNLFFFDLAGHRTLREVVNIGSGPAAQPSALGSKYMVPTNNGALNLIDPKTGKTLWVYAVRPIGGFASKQGEGPVFNGRDIIDPRILTIPAAGAAVLNSSTMLIMCNDASLLAFDAKTGVDLTPPDADLLFPKPGAQISGTPPLDIILKVNDEATGVNLNTLKIDVDGTPLKFFVGRDGVVLIHLSVNGPNMGLLDGRRVLNVSLSDWMGNQTKKTFSLMIDNSLPALSTPPGLKGPGKTGRGKGTGVGGGGGGGGGDIG
jgi:outer membrane protein assembly factor BamB